MMTVRGRWVSRLTGLLSAAAVAAAGLALTHAAAYADEGDPPPTPPATGERGGGRLQRCLQRENEWLSAQAGNIDRAGQAAARADELMAEARSRGIDPSELEALLANANAQLGTARSEHAAAGAILAAHAGFDDSGGVTDREQARDTCLDARQDLNDARQALVEVREIAVEMREIVRAWWRDHGPAPTSAG